MRTKSSERRQAILDAARAVMEEVGYEQATIERLKTASPEMIRTEALTLEEIFIASLNNEESPE